MNVEQTIIALEEKIVTVLKTIDVLKTTNSNLVKALEQEKQNMQLKETKFKNLEANFESLKIANSMLGSNDNKRDTKLKINALVREIDSCIAQLSTNVHRQ